MSCSIIVSKKKMSTWKQGVQCQRGNTIYFILHRSVFHEQRQDNGADFWENFPYEMLLLASIWEDLLPKLWYLGMYRHVIWYTGTDIIEESAALNFRIS